MTSTRTRGGAVDPITAAVPAAVMPTGPSTLERVRSALAGTPGSLRMAGLLAALFAVVFGLLASEAVDRRSDAIAEIRAESAQLVRLQRVRTNLVAADAAATNAFLVGGLEPAQARRAYEQGIERAMATLAAAASETDGDAARFLGDANQDLAVYAGRMEAARANNRQGFPVGVAYLKQASSLLRDEVLPVLTAVSDASSRDVEDAYDDSRTAIVLLWVGAALALLAFLGAQVVLAMRTRRLLSLPLLGAAGIVVVVAVVAGAGMAFAQAKANDVRDGGYGRATALAQARIDSFDAKSAESLTLISRGSGEAFEKRFQDTAGSARAALDRTGDDRLGSDRVGTAELDAYLATHERIRDLDVDGNWDGAVALATGDDPDGANATFASFDDVTGTALESEASGIADELRTARAPLGALRIILLITGLLAAAAAWQAAAIRLREYR